LKGNIRKLCDQTVDGVRNFERHSCIPSLQEGNPLLYLVALAVIAVLTLFAVLSSKTGQAGVALIGVFVAAVVSLAFSYTQIENNKVGVGRSFGATYESAYGPGSHWTAPWVAVTSYEALRREFPVSGLFTTGDSNPLEVEVGFATKLNNALAWRVQQTLGEDYFTNLVQPAGSTAAREGISAYPWVALTTSERGKVQATIQKDFEDILHQQMVAAGMTQEEAEKAITVFPVQLRQALPDQKVRNAVAEKTASEQDLDRQKTLTKIAEQEALRREAEGTGVTKLFDALPKGFSSEEIATVLSALATKTRADAMMKAVESNQVRDIIMNGDVAPNPAISRSTVPAAPLSPSK
jgi:regulator of protease activity HflC (stomatin/prohibitin superfamily)